MLVLWLTPPREFSSCQACPLPRWVPLFSGQAPSSSHLTSSPHPPAQQRGLQVTRSPRL